MPGSVQDSCFVFWNLDVQACAAWVQAWGSILALAIAGGGLVYQARQQRKLADSIARRESTEKYMRSAGALSGIASGANNLLLQLIEQIPDRAAFVRSVAEGAHQLVAVELNAMERWLHAIPVHDVPHDVLHEMLILTGNIRQVRHHVDIALSIGQRMEEAQFQAFHQMLVSARTSVGQSAVFFEVRVAQSRARAEA